MKRWIGIDVSNKDVDAAIPQAAGGYEVIKYDQTEADFVELYRRIKPGMAVAIEETGPYSARLLDWLYQRGVAVHTVGSWQVHAFKQMQGKRAKTDQVDAVAIAEYATQQGGKPWQPEAAYLHKIREYSSMIAQLQKQRTALKNRVHALNKQPRPDALLMEMQTELLQLLQQNVVRLETEIKHLLQQHAAPQAELLQSIPGLGKRTIPLLILHTQNFTAFRTGRQLAAYLGLTPTTYQSGSSVWRKPRLSKMGDAYLRSRLYLCALSAIRYNPACKTFYHRLLKEGKTKNSALNAVAHKLVRIAFAVVKNNRPFDPNYPAAA